jgi:hypothetical protein
MTVSALTTTSTTAATLSKLGNGEYTPASVSADPSDATKLGLVKEQDGNYGTASAASIAASGSAAGQSSSAVQIALTALSLGGP